MAQITNRRPQAFVLKTFAAVLLVVFELHRCSAVPISTSAGPIHPSSEDSHPACRMIQQDWPALDEVKQYVCETKEQYKESMTFGVNGPLPGPNTWICDTYMEKEGNSDILSFQQTNRESWKTMFAYKAGVFNTLVRQQYIAKMKYLQSRHFNNEKNLEVFNQRFAFIQNSSDTYLTTIQRLLNTTAQRDMASLSPTQWDDSCSDEFVLANTATGDWPPTETEDMTKDELAELRMYTYGTLKATCGAMESLSESVGVAHDSLCV